MIDKSIYIPLFTEKSKSVESPFFHIFPGSVVVARAFDFDCTRTPMSEDEFTNTPVKACLEQVMFREDFDDDPSGQNRGITVYDMKFYVTKLLAISPVVKNGCQLSLSADDTVMLLNVPGSYRFVLNDQASVGNARIYLQSFSHEEFPWNSKFFMGEE